MSCSIMILLMKLLGLRPRGCKISKYNGQIKNLLQGVSQQSDKERRSEQLTSQQNCKSSIIDGLGKRGGTTMVAQYHASYFPSGDNTSFYNYDRGDTEERYLLGVGHAAINAIDLTTGDAVEVVFDASATYLNTTTPKEAFRFHTIADTTFILNNTKVPATNNPSTSSDVWQSLVYCRRANWGKKYKIIIDGTTVATYTTPATVVLATTTTSVEANKAATVKTTEIIDELLADGLTAWAAAEGVTLVRHEDVVHLYKATGTYKIGTSDDNYGTDLFVIGELFSDYTKLPEVSPDGYKIKITGVDNNTANDYYVKFQSDVDATIGRGSWEESIGFGIDQDFDPTTMPHKLVRESDGKFYFRECEWDAREAGDDDSNPEPSFVGSTISNIVSYQGRLVLSTEESQCASVTFEYFNFWSNSVTVSADDDPIDTASSDNQVTNLHNTLVFNSSLVSFSDKAQFVHPGDAKFSSDSFSLASKIRFANNIKCAPVASATSIFFSNDFGAFSGIRELKTDNLTGNVKADPVTEHCKKYIKGSALQIASSTDYNLICVRTDATEDPMLYVYEWYDKDDTRIQSAWHAWDFGRPIAHVSIIHDTLYVLLDRDNEFSLESIDLSDKDDTGCEFALRLDTREELIGYTSGDNWLISPTITLLPGVVIDDLAVIAGDDTQLPGTAVTSEVSGNNILIPKGNITSSGTPKFFVGVPFSAEAEITNPYIKDQAGNVKTHGNLKLATMKFNLATTGYVTFDVLGPSGDTYTKVYDTRIIDDSLFTLDAPPSLVDAQVSVPIRTYRDKCTITIKSESHLPFNISDVDWSGTYYESGRRTL